MKLRLFLLPCCLFLMSLASYGQGDFRQQFVTAKNLFLEGKYNLAMEAFKPVIPYDAANPYSQYASFYYAIAAYRQGYLSVAQDMLNQIRKVSPNWDKMEEVNYWLGVIHMDNSEYFEGLNAWKGIRNQSVARSIEASKKKCLARIEDPETLRMMLEEYPNDRIIASALAQLLASRRSNPADREEFENVVRKYRLQRSSFINEAPPTYHKPVYTVSLMYPFMLSTLDPTPGRKRNQLILDLYEGMKLAVDTLSSQGVKIELRAYDTERKTATINRLLATPELKNTDLIIGPFFPDENKLIQDFANANRINVFKPFTNNLEMIGSNEFSFMIQPAYETIGEKSADFAASQPLRSKNCIIFYGTSKRDSVLAASFAAKAAERGLNIVLSQRIPRDGSAAIIDILATPTEFDEWKKPIQFTIEKDSIACIFVASDDALIYSKVISSVETRGDGILVVGSKAWLEQPALDLEKFERLNVVFSAPGFASTRSRHYQAFARKYLRKNGVPPSEYALLGYETMLFLGNAMKKNGVYFQEAFSKGRIPGYLTQGYDYTVSHDNRVVPFVRFVNGELTVVETL
jgi:tetratricopeptide (TPR) repeat protein